MLREAIQMCWSFADTYIMSIVYGRTWDENCVLTTKGLLLPKDWLTQKWGWRENPILHTVFGRKHDRHNTILFLWGRWLLSETQGQSPPMVLPTLPSRAWRFCHMSKWLWAAHQKKCLGPSLCPHAQPESSVGTSLGGSRSWLCCHRHPWARSPHG